MLRRGGHRLIQPYTNYPEIEDISTKVAQCALCDGSLSYTEEKGWDGSLIRGDGVCYVARGQVANTGPDFKALSRDQQLELTVLRGRIETYRTALEEVEMVGRGKVKQIAHEALK